MRILALILARGGSKRLPGKNIRSLGGKPLIVWSIETALALDGLCDVIVSTEDAQIASVARSAGATVPWLRPSELSTDTATSLDVTLHALDWYESEHGSVDGLLLLQPTSPFRSRETLLRGLSAFEASGGAAVVGVVPALTHPMWALRLKDGMLTPFIDGNGLKTRSQDLPEAFSLTGAFYLVQPATLRAERTFFPKRTVPLVQDLHEGMDIDTLEDFQLAEALFAIRQGGTQ